MGAVLKAVPVSAITVHPDHPRLGPREELVAAIASAITGGLPEEKAVLVRPRGAGYELLDGKARRDAAVWAGLKEVPAWVKELNDDDARLELVVANVRDELSPLEIGLHALKTVPAGAGGRGNKGGLSAYAARIGKRQQQVSVWRHGAEVAVDAIPTSQLVGFLHRADHLAALRKTHPSAWPALTRLIREKDWSVKATEGVAAKVAAVFGPAFDPAGAPWWDLFLPVGEVVTKLATEDRFTADTVRDLIGLADQSAVLFPAAPPGGAPDPRRAEWEAELKAGTGCASWNPRILRRRRDELRNALGAAPGAVPDIGWYQGKWQAHIDKLPDGGVAAVVTDPPFGMNYRAKSGRRGPMAGDRSLAGAGADLAEFLKAIRPKLKPGAQVFVFCRHDSEPLFAAALARAGLTVRSHAIWVKNNHGPGDLKGLAPMHERILHATLGDPDLYERHPDVFVYPKVATGRHDTEKPQALIERLIVIGTARGDLVADPYGGVGTTAAAARATGRRCWSCEIDEEHFQDGQARLEGMAPGPVEPAPAGGAP